MRVEWVDRFERGAPMRGKVKRADEGGGYTSKCRHDAEQFVGKGQTSAFLKLRL